MPGFRWKPSISSGTFSDYFDWSLRLLPSKRYSIKIPKKKYQWLRNEFFAWEDLRTTWELLNC